MKDKFKSDLFETAQELVQAKNNAVTANRDRRDRLKDVRNFSNGLAMMTEEEAKKLGRKEITNHLTTYGKLLNQVLTMRYSRTKYYGLAWSAEYLMRLLNPFLNDITCNPHASLCHNIRRPLTRNLLSALHVNLFGNINFQRG
jgi:hypothetical protein